MFLEIYTLPILSNLFFPKVDEQSRLAVRENFLLVFRTPFLAVRAIVMFFNWFAVSFISYGLNLNWQTLTGNLFTNFVIAA